MDAFITALTAGITPTVLYGVLTSLVPFLVVIVPVALGYHFIKKLVKGAAKAKVRL